MHVAVAVPVVVAVVVFAPVLVSVVLLIRTHAVSHPSYDSAHVLYVPLWMLYDVCYHVLVVLLCVLYDVYVV